MWATARGECFTYRVDWGRRRARTGLQVRQLMAVTTAEETGIPGLSLHSEFVSEDEERVRACAPALAAGPPPHSCRRGNPALLPQPTPDDLLFQSLRRPPLLLHAA